MKLFSNINPIAHANAPHCPNHIWAVDGIIMPVIGGNYNDRTYSSGLFKNGEMEK